MYWTFWIGGLALASVAAIHWLWVGRLMSVSSRVTALVEAARGEATGEPATRHFAFLGGLALGGLVASLAFGRVGGAFSMGDSFTRLFGSSPVVAAVLVILGGALVGFGTRLAKGCTSGHGLSGVARLERGSLAATVAFFGTAVLVSLTLSALLGGDA
jgi:uncharacterized membrane protein YedE/YeeE